MHPADLHFADQNLQLLRMASGSVLPCGGLSEEAATPGHLRAERVLGNPPAIHPRELPETTGSAVALQQGVQDISRFECQHCA